MWQFLKFFKVSHNWWLQFENPRVYLDLLYVDRGHMKIKFLFFTFVSFFNCQPTKIIYLSTHWVRTEAPANFRYVHVCRLEMSSRWNLWAYHSIIFRNEKIKIWLWIDESVAGLVESTTLPQRWLLHWQMKENRS